MERQPRKLPTHSRPSKRPEFRRLNKAVRNDIDTGHKSPKESDLGWFPGIQSSLSVSAASEYPVRVR